MLLCFVLSATREFMRRTPSVSI